MKLKIALTRKYAKTPTYGTEGSACMDLYAAESTEVYPLITTLVRTGLSIAIPQGYAGYVSPRSGLARRYGLTIINSPGVIDSDYRGEIMIPMTVVTGNVFNITVGDRIAQMAIIPVHKVEFELVNTQDLGETSRGVGGMGSTGLR